MKCKPKIRAALAFSSSTALAAEERARLEEVIVTAPPLLDPLIVRIDHRKPRHSRAGGNP